MNILPLLSVLLAITSFFVFFLNFIIFFVSLLLYDYKGGFSVFKLLGLIFNLNSESDKNRKIIRYRKRMVFYGGVSLLITIILAYSLQSAT